MPKKKKRIAMVLTLAVVLVALAVGSGGTAFAQLMGSVIQCQGIPCVATGDHDVLFEQVGDGVPDRMLAQGNHDLLRAQNYTNDRDVAKGGFGNDRLLVNDGDAMDGAIGGAGNDLCVVDAAVEASYTCERVIYR
jgi:Ca2+-binding RTX toxin-like protein